MRRWLGRAILAITGWKAGDPRPAPRKYVLIAAPHTSNWDLVYLLCFAELFRIKISWMGKRQIFRFPFGSLMRWLGGLPVRREQRNSLVESGARELRERDDLVLVVPAEGTRSRAPHWKSGFYHIARLAEVPIVLGYLDYPSKTGGFGPAITPSGDIKADMDRIRAFYADKRGKHPEFFGEIKLKDEG